ncbi:recombinase RecT, partial [uncultured Porphyromonas sp.]|uniref:recombinase RecT n=1 Tax=uncultured Porphyromonas sp. TaxID=159274 RepID=UPI0027DB7458
NEYDKQQSVWNEKKSTMIAKIAKVQALREAFPTQLGAMYTAEEVAEYSDVPTTQVEATSQTQATSAMEKAKQAMAKSVAEASESTEEVPQEATATAELEAVAVESKDGNKMKAN